MKLADVDFETVELKDVVVLRFAVPVSEHHNEAVCHLAEQLDRFVVVLGPGDDFESLDEDGMRQHGWCKIGSCPSP